jgi:hypothetical protein
MKLSVSFVIFHLVVELLAIWRCDKPSNPAGDGTKTNAANFMAFNFSHIH